MKGRIIKTVVMSYSKKSKIDKILKKQIYEKYSHAGKRNFLTYALNASKKEYLNSKGEVKEGMDSKSIRKQVASHIRFIKLKLKTTNVNRIYTKMRKGKLKRVKF